MAEEERARQAGARACHAGKAYAENPYGSYLSQKKLKLAWSRGFNDARVMTIFAELKGQNDG